MKILTTIGILVFTANILPACPAGRGTGNGCSGGSRLASTAPLTLDAAAKAALSFQIEEERMAGELYRAFGEKQVAPPFQNIPRAEARHQELLVSLANRAGLGATGPAQAGHYETPAMQTRYDTLLARGRISLIEALKVGALVEEQDIADLRALTATTNDSELKAAATMLEEGSRHHLGAFVRNLRAQGVEYVAQVLTPAELAALTTSTRRDRG